MLSAPHVLPGPCAWPRCPAVGPHCHLAGPVCRARGCWNLDCATCRQAWIRGQVPPTGAFAPPWWPAGRGMASQREQVETRCGPLLARVPDQVRRLRTARHLRQADLACLAGVPTRTIRRLERSRVVARIPLEVVVRLALTLEVGLETLCGHDATPAPSLAACRRVPPCQGRAAPAASPGAGGPA
jgi:DNA-binding XRE family transcriptional regulator